MNTIIELYTKPDQFFAKKMERPIDLIGPFLIYFINLLVLVSVFSILMRTTFPEDFSQNMTAYHILSDMFYLCFLGVSSIWVCNAVMLYIISMLFNGQGSFKRVFEFTGYVLIAYLPLFLSLLSLLAGVLPALENFDFELAMEQLESGIMSSTYLSLWVIINLAIANMHRAALRYSRGLSNQNASIVAGIIFLINLFGYLH